ncbi:MAG: PhzF family phenazine biosynthesis protein [Pseudomonadales bacterium]|nr:PhzF family phenazine biosynthesis protein [Pseudomonadales bacterium]
MDLNYYLVDVFTDTPFSGAQIAVFPDAHSVSQRDRELIANELNLWETVFITGSDNASRFQLKVQTPQKETSIGAHTTIAASYTLAKSGALKSQDSAPIFFENNNEEQTIYVTYDKGEIKQTLLTSRVTPQVDRFTPTKEELAEILNLNPNQLRDKRYAPLIVSCETAYLIIPVKSLQAVVEARFNYQAWSTSTAPATFAQEILLFCTETEHSLTDFHLRLLGPSIGRLEDPPVGASTPAFAAYLCDHKHIKPGTHVFAVERGLEQARQSILHLEMDNKGESTLTVRVGGSAVFTGEGKIHLKKNAE